jgi:hypothetical protein
MFSVRQRLLGAAALLLAATACSKNTATGPTTLSNPTSVTANLNGVDSTFTTAQFQSFIALFGGSSGAGPSAPFSAIRRLVRATAPERTNRQNAAARSLAVKALAPMILEGTQGIIPDSLKGKTFVYDTTANKYVVSADTGAPAAGVRFILYAVDDTGAIIRPPTPVGHLDLIDKSTVGTTSLEVVVANSTMTFVDYTVTGSGNTTTAFTISTTGYIRSSVRELDFSISYTLAVGTFTIHEQFDDAADDAHLLFLFGIVATSDTSATVTATFTFSHGGQSIVITGGGTLTTNTSNIQATVKVNGGVFANISSVNGTATITDKNGNPLSLEDRLALARMFDILGRALDWLNDLVEPFIAVANIGVIINL